MPKYKKREPEYTAIQFTGSNIREVMDELGPEFSTIYDLDIKGATNFVLKGYGWGLSVLQGQWVVVEHETQKWRLEFADAFEQEYEPVKRVGRPPKQEEAKTPPKPRKTSRKG